MKEKFTKKKGKGSQKVEKDGIQTITSMFKKQRENNSSAEKVAVSGTRSESKVCTSDDDVIITAIESKSQYFPIKEQKSKKKLSLRKSLSRETVKTCGSVDTSCDSVDKSCDVEESGDDILKKDAAETEFHENVKDETISTSQKENQIESNDTGNSSKVSEVADVQASCSRSGLLTIKRSERKTKSDDTTDGQDKKRRDAENSGLLTEKRSERKRKSDDMTDGQDKKRRDTENFVKIHQELEEMDDSSNYGGDSQQAEIEVRTPYYLENFRTILSTVLQCEDNRKLFNENDLKHITTLQELPESAQKLYIRLFLRKWAWLTQQKIKYPEISEDLTEVIQELICRGFLEDETQFADLEKALQLLPATELKAFAKTYHLASLQNKKEIIPALIKKSKENTIGSMFKMVGYDGSNAMLKKVKKLLGRCVHLTEEPRHVFIRTLMLFSLTDTIPDDDSPNNSSVQLFRMLQVNIGETVYPTFTVHKDTQVFQDRDSVLRFSEASLMETELMRKLDKNDYVGAYDVFQQAEEKTPQLKKMKSVLKYDEKLPVFLRPYTAFSVYTRILNQGVELLQRRKEYNKAVALLKKLLSQETYCIDYRGHWWERLALNYDAHLKDPEKAIEVVEKGLKDNHVTAGRRLALYLRAEKICNAPKSKFKDRLALLPNESVAENPTVTIEGMVLSDNVPGMRYKFIMADPDGALDDITFCGVEELAMEHYKQNGYPEGLHAEGSVVSNLFALFFWDIMFMDVPDAFHCVYQTHPLDLYSIAFYSNRKDAIDQQLKKISESQNEELHAMIETVWESHFGVMCTGLNWERFSSLSHVQGLVTCIGGEKLSRIFERFVKNPRHTRSGFPDLTMWNPEEKSLKISEVKGPGDRLSHKQILWIDYLVSIGVDAEVCYVKAVSSKKLKSSK